MTLEKPYLRQRGLFEVGKFAKKPYFVRFCCRSKRAAPFPDGRHKTTSREQDIDSGAGHLKKLAAPLLLNLYNITSFIFRKPI